MCADKGVFDFSKTPFLSHMKSFPHIIIQKEAAARLLTAGVGGFFLLLHDFFPRRCFFPAKTLAV